MANTHPQPPDVQGNSDNGLPDAGLPMGSSVQGMYGNSTGDLSLADVHRGFQSIPDELASRPLVQREGDEDEFPPMQPGGFAGRPGGWER